MLETWMWQIKFDICECHNDVDAEAVGLCSLSLYDTIRFFGKRINPPLDSLSIFVASMFIFILQM